ncbi:hypothetical protein [Pseudomonas shirazensis]
MRPPVPAHDERTRTTRGEQQCGEGDDGDRRAGSCQARRSGGAAA